ncbi:hypothetical protein J4E83_005869 [Alternaria metachromatica]|uniref:uncharacterized protein n=1 Tax=Alternaria metachromatica TaxID=283354 RepID=UPI0020C29F4F|nr:uncharacterized protein J4E83_005869 [Alternaria metachromatica]KAI4618918.1 hypothetical protein J4E83_005869 [Alternaria metachromatica]
MIVDVGMPIKHHNIRYICRVMAYNGRIVSIRPKTTLRTDGNYNESRWFTAWDPAIPLEVFPLPDFIADMQGTSMVPFGSALLSTSGACVGAITSDELIGLEDLLPTALSSTSADVLTVSAANHFSVGNFDSLVSSLQNISKDIGGVILYSNQHGCDGDQSYYDGGPMILVNGEIVSQGPRFSVHDVEVVTAVVDLEEVQLYRAKHAVSEPLDDLTTPRVDIITILLLGPQAFTRWKKRSAWDHPVIYGECVGFLAPLSGGIDSCSTSVMVLSMCYLVFDALQDGNDVASDIQRITGADDWLPKTPQELCNRILHTVYMGMSECSSEETRSRAQRLADGMGAHHISMSIDTVYRAERDLLPQYTGFTPDFRGSSAENLALQNLQARIRSTTAYYLARTLPVIRNHPGGGGLLVLSSVNVEESLRGNLTKHDCSSADLSPIGSISKIQLRSFIRWARTAFTLPILDEFLDAIPRAELEPASFGSCDDKENGMTHQELFVFAKLRSEERLGPFDMFQRLLCDWQDRKSAREVGDLVKRFWTFYGNNRHKMAAVTPAVHAAGYSPDNRFDQRPMLYPRFEHSWAFKRIDGVVDELERRVKMEEDEEIRFGEVGFEEEPRVKARL